MKRIILLFAFSFRAVLPVVAQTQTEMTQQAIAAFEKADARLNQVYRRLLDVVDDDAKTKLRAAQRAWLAYRDAESEFEAENLASGGTLFNQIIYSARTELTEARIKALKEAFPKS